MRSGTNASGASGSQLLMTSRSYGIGEGARDGDTIASRQALASDPAIWCLGLRKDSTLSRRPLVALVLHAAKK